VYEEDIFSSKHCVHVSLNIAPWSRTLADVNYRIYANRTVDPI